MSKERARRRAERDAAAALLAAREARRARWRALTGVDRLRRLRRRPAAPVRTRSTALGRRRARENGLLLAVLVPLNAVYWLLEPSWAWRLVVLAASAIAWPVLVVVFFDRRSSG